MNPENEQYKKQEKISLVSMVAELPNFIAISLSAMFSNSLIVWADFVDVANNLFRLICMALFSRKLKRDLRFEYNYGTGKVEAIAAIVSDISLLVGTGIMILIAVIELRNPKSPSEFVGYVVCIKIVNILIDIYFCFCQKAICKTKNSKIANSEMASYLKNTLFDSVVLVSLCIIIIFRDVPQSWIFSPIMSILLAVFLSVDVIKRMKDSLGELSDITLEEEKQQQILKIIVGFHDDFVGFGGVRTRRSGDVIFIDLLLEFREDMTYQDMMTLLGKMDEVFTKEIKGCEISFILNNRRSSKLC